MKGFLMLVMLAGLFISGINTAAAAITGEQDLLIFYSNDVLGETEPCG